MEWKVPLTTVTLGAEEQSAAARIVASGWMTMGAEVAAFEAEFAAALDARHAVAVANATAGLDLAYEVCDLAAGDAFILPALTFVAALNVGLRRGALPAFLDITSEDDWTPSVAHLREIVDEDCDAKLVVSMPYGGFCPDMPEVLAIAGRAGMPVVEDSCHAPLARLGGRCMGTFGHVGTFSFFGNKNMTTGEGGMVVTNDEAVARKLRLLRSHGMTTVTYDRHHGHASGYDVMAAGHNFRMDEMRAAIGREQLRKLPTANAARGRIAASIRERLAVAAPDVRLPFADHPGESAHHLLPALLPRGVNREVFMQMLRERGVQSSVHYRPLHRFSHVRDLACHPRLPVLESIEDRMVTLPLGPGFTEEQIEWLVKAVKESL